MEERPIRCRRARRGDVDAIFALLASPPPDSRGARHQFRKLVADLGADCYVALRDEIIVGVVHVTYARRLAEPPRATVELVLAADGAADQVGQALARLVSDRAQRRRCATIDCRDLDGEVGAAFAAALGARPAGACSRVEIPVPRG